MFCGCCGLGAFVVFDSVVVVGLGMRGLFCMLVGNCFSGCCKCCRLAGCLW